MEWFYDSNGQQSGPISDSQLDDLVRSGAIRNDTLVWRDGMADWQPLFQARPAGGDSGGLPPVLPPLIVSPPGSFCVECQRPFPQSEMVQLNKSWVCAQCKPIFLQRLMEGSSPGAGPVSNGLVWRFDRQLVTRSETPLPDRCVRCNAPAKGYRLKRQLSWHPPAYYLLILVSVLIYVIVAVCIRKKALLHIGLCETHRTQRTRYILISCLTAVAGVGLLIAAAVWDNGIPALIGLVMIIAGIVIGALKAPVISAAKIDKDFVWVKGADRTFLAELPEWYGPR